MDVKANRGKPMSEKDVTKLERNCKKLEEALVKSDRDYKEANMKTEEARLAWEAAMYRCCKVRLGGRERGRERDSHPLPLPPSLPPSLPPLSGQTLEDLELERCQQVQLMLVKYSQLVETVIRPTEQVLHY